MSTDLARRDTWIARAKVPQRNGLDIVDWRGQEALVANLRPLATPAKRRLSPADWPLKYVVLGHVLLATLLVIPVLVLVHHLSH